MSDNGPYRTNAPIQPYRDGLKPKDGIIVGDGLLLKQPRIIPSAEVNKHKCKKPGFFKRLFLKLDYGDLWMCNACNQVWEMHYIDPIWRKVSQETWDKTIKEVENAK
jgi:hypothetical protein